MPKRVRQPNPVEQSRRVRRVAVAAMFRSGLTLQALAQLSGITRWDAEMALREYLLETMP